MRREQQLVIAAFAVIYFVWGSTYLANAWAIEAIPAFLMCGSRFFLAGLLLFGFTTLQGGPWPNLQQWRNAGFIGLLFLSFGTGAAVWGLNYIPSGLAALVISFNPLVIMLLMWLLLGKKIQGRSLIGVAISIIGVSILVNQPALVGSWDTIKGLLAICLAMVSWAFASIYTSRVDMGNNRARATAMQMIIGGILLLLFSLTSGEAMTWSPDMLNARSVWSWFYLIAFGSILAFLSFNFLLAKVSPEKVATSTYVNPIIALLLGYALNGEDLLPRSLLAGGIMLMGVYFINSSK